jgi:transcription termination factor Rho
MSAVLDRSALEQSPLADLHLIANELGVDGFRRLRKAELIDRIVDRQSGADAGAPAGDEEATTEAIVAADAADVEEDDDARRPRRGRRGGRSRARVRDEDGATDEDAGSDEPEPAPVAEAKPESGRRRSRGDRDRGERGGERNGDRERGDRGDRGERGERGDDREDKVVEGEIELLANGSGFVRLAPPEPTDDDVYVSAAQVKRCELVTGDRVSGPVRAPRRSERFPSLVRVDTINGRPADEVAEGTRFEDLPVAFPSERFELGGEDPTVQAIEWLTPIGKGSRVVLAGGPRAGKTEALRRLAAALKGRDGLELTLVLAGVRPEEVAGWSEDGFEPVASLSFAASPDAQAQAIEQAVEQGRRVAARGGDAVVLVDTLDYVPAGAARRALAAARNLAQGGSLTIVATSAAPLGGETTVVAFDAARTALGQFPAVDLSASGTLRPETLVGEAGAEAIAKARAEQA